MKRLSNRSFLTKMLTVAGLLIELPPTITKQSLDLSVSP